MYDFVFDFTLLRCFLLRTQRRGMFVVKSGRTAFFNLGSSAHGGGGWRGYVISCGGGVYKQAFFQCEHDIFSAVLKSHIAELVPALRGESSLRLFGHL